MNGADASTPPLINGRPHANQLDEVTIRPEVGSTPPTGRFRHANFIFDLTSRRTCIALFVILTVPTLLGLSILAGPFQTYDEAANFYRSVQLSEGRFLPVKSPNGNAAGDYLDATLQRLGGYYTSRAYTRWDTSFGSGKEDFEAAWAEPLAGRVEFTKFSNTVIYFPLAHVAPALTISLLRHLDAPPMAWAYGARLTNAGLAVLIYCVAIAFFPEGRAFVFVAALLPRTLFATASISPDALLIPFAALFAALVGRLAKQGSLPHAQLALLIISTFFISVNKLAYIPFVTIPPMISAIASRRLSHSTIVLAVAGSATLLVWAAWMVTIRNDVFPIRHDANIDIYGQLYHLLQHPLRGVVVLKNSILKTGWGYLNTMVGGPLGSRETRLPKVVAGITYVFLIGAAFLGRERIRARLVEFGFTAVIVCGTVLAIFLLLYMQYTALDFPMVEGVQGRYFLPLLPVLVAFLPKVKLSTSSIRTLSLATFVWLSITSAETLYLMKARYWSVMPDAVERFQDFQHTDIE